MRPRYEVADIFRQYGEAYKKTHAMTGEQRKVMAAIMACRTSRLGGHQEICRNCGTVRNSYNSCRNRHCPKCQAMAGEEWLAKRRQELLPCGYFHLVFTLPHALNPLVLAHRRQLLGLLFSAVRETLFAFAADPRWKLEGRPGILTVLHTWSQVLIDHFHIHCLVPAGVLSFDGTTWKAGSSTFLFDTRALGKEFKKRYLTQLEQAIKKGALPADAAVDRAWDKQWIVYAKKPFAGPEQVLEYLGRYTHRIAIANHRIKSIDNGQVVFTYRDRQDNNRNKTMTLDAGEFIRRFLLHVLPFRFMKIRYYGFLANTCRKKSVLLIRRLIGKCMEVEHVLRETTREKMLRLTGRDILLCPFCRQMTMESRLIPPMNSG